MSDEQRLRAFALDVLRDWPDVMAWEGWDLEALAVKHGLLIPTEVHQRCGDNCACAKYGEGFPMICNKIGPALTGAS